MKTLRQIIVKRAEEEREENSVNLDAVLPKEILKPLRAGQVPAGHVSSIIESLSSRITTAAIRHRQVRAANAEAFRTHVNEYLKKYQPQMEAEAYKNYSPLTAPVSPKETALTAAEFAAFPYAVGKGVAGLTYLTEGRAAGRAALAGSLGIGGSLNYALGPGSLVPMSIFGGITSALEPIGDPLYRRGERSYLSSVGAGVQAEASELTRKGIETRKRFGPLGIGVQLFHGITHPIASLYMGEEAIRNYLKTNEGQKKALEGQAKIAEALAPPKVAVDAADMNVIIRKLGRLPKCSFARDREGIFALTHRARSKSYASASKISKSAIEFVESTV